MNPTCSICRGDWYPVKETYRGNVCSDCRELCECCKDWMENEPEVVVKGRRYHAVCFLDLTEAA